MVWQVKFFKQITKTGSLNNVSDNYTVDHHHQSGVFSDLIVSTSGRNSVSGLPASMVEMMALVIEPPASIVGMVFQKPDHQHLWSKRWLWHLNYYHWLCSCGHNKEGEYALAEWTGTEKRYGVTTWFRSRTHIYSALSWRLWSYYQSMGLEFRYSLGRC